MTTVINDLLERVGAGTRDAARQEAARELVNRYSPMLLAVTRRAGLSEERAHDVVQTTWLRLFESPESIREPEHLGGWLKTVATREAWRMSGEDRREIAYGDLLPALAALGPGPEERLVQAEEVTWLRQAIGRLPGRQRQVMCALTLEPALTYQEIARCVGIPIGSIGPTRARAVDQLRRLRTEQRSREPEPRTPGRCRSREPRRELAVAS